MSIESRRNAIALLIAAFVLAVSAAFAIRSAAVLPDESGCVHLGDY